MAIEFTRLADVTAIEEVKDEDTVLVVQDGEVKRAPKTAVGGGGEWDAVFDIVEDWLNINNYTFTSGSYSDLRDKILAGQKPNILIRNTYEYGNTFYGFLSATYIEASSSDEEPLWIVVTNGDNGNFWLGINPDGTLTA